MYIVRIVYTGALVGSVRTDEPIYRGAASLKRDNVIPKSNGEYLDCGDKFSQLF